jgi:hypothetical protein
LERSHGANLHSKLQRTSKFHELTSAHGNIVEA